MANYLTTLVFVKYNNKMRLKINSLPPRMLLWSEADVNTFRRD